MNKPWGTPLILGINPSPYCGFKSDRERRKALVSRDIRLVLVALIVTWGAPMLPHWWAAALHAMR